MTWTLDATFTAAPLVNSYTHGAGYIDGVLYLGVAMSDPGDPGSTLFLVGLDATTGALAFAEDDASKVVSPARAVVAGGSGKVVVGTYTTLCRLNADGTVDASFVDETDGGGTRSLLKVVGGYLYVGRNDTAASVGVHHVDESGELIGTVAGLTDGDTTLLMVPSGIYAATKTQLCRISLDTLTLDTAFTPVAYSTFYANTAQLVELQDGSLVFAVDAENIGGTGRGSVVRVQQNGTINTAFTFPVHRATTMSMAVAANGALVVYDKAPSTEALEVSVRHPGNGALLEVAELLSGVKIAYQPAPNIAMVYASGGAPAFYMIVEPGTSTLTAPAVLKYSYSAPPLFGHPDDLGDAAMAADATVCVVLDNLKDKLVARETLQTGALFRSGLDGKAAFTDIVGAAWQMLLADAGELSDTTESTVRRLAALAETMLVKDAALARMDAFIAVAAAAVLEARTATGVGAQAIDQAVLADEIGNTLAVMLDAADAGAVSVDASGGMRLLLVASDAATVADDPEAALRALAELADGAVLYCTLRLGGTDYQGWVLNTDLRAVTEYRNVPFDSFAILNGRTYAAGEGGIYELAGDTDNGEPISAWFRPFLTNFGTQKMKRVTDIWLGTSATGLFVKVHTRDPATGKMTEDVYPVQHAHGDGTDKGRVKVGRGLTSNWWTLTVQNVAGADFAIDGIEWKPLLLDRRQ